MPFAIELLFDPKTNAAVRRIGKRMEINGIPFALNRAGASPHISLAGFKAPRGRKLGALLKKIADRSRRFSFRLPKIGAFRREGVLFLRPDQPAELLKIHSELHEALRGAVKGSNSHYLPKNWVPHCTLGMSLTPSQMRKALKILRGIKPSIKGACCRLALVEYYPIKEMAAFKLRSGHPLIKKATADKGQ
jgi:2'-5' RNA ligase